MGKPNNFLINIEVNILAASEIEGIYVLRIDIGRIKNELQQVLQLVGKIRIIDEIRQNSTN